MIISRIGKAKRDYDPLNKEKYLIPGPQQYTPKIMEKSATPIISFGKGKRIPLTNTDFVPGPGHYNSNFKLGDGVPKVSHLLK